MSFNYPKNYKLIVSLFLITVITFIAFYPSLKNGFTNWDDQVYIQDNPLTKEFSFSSIKKIFTTLQCSFYHPFTLLSYSLETYFFGMNPLVYHITNLILHIFNSLLVFWLIYLISNRCFSSFIASILFAVHPLHVESVAWISERKDVLSTLFFVLTLIFYVYYKKSKQKKFYYFSLLVFLFSLLAKPMGITIPFLLLIFDYILAEKFRKDIFIDKISFLIIAFAFTYITVISFSTTSSSFKISNIFIASYGLLYYLIKFLVPLNLSSLHLPPDGSVYSLPQFLIAPLLVLLLFGIVFYFGRSNRKVIFGSLFFLITILPVIQLIPNTFVIVADRYTYIPSIGIFYMLGEGLFWLYYVKLRDYSLLKKTLAAILIVLIAMLSFLTWNRCKIWKDSITLWNDVIRYNPAASLAYYNRGNAYSNLHLYSMAVEDYSMALEIDSEYILAYQNRGNIYYQTGQLNNALEDYNQVIRFDPYNKIAYVTRGNIYFDRGEYKKALSDLNRSLNIDPSFVDGFNNRGILYASQGEYDKALSDFNSAINISPNNLTALYNRAITYVQTGENDKAMEDIKSIESYYPEKGEEFFREFYKLLEGKNKL